MTLGAAVSVYLRLLQETPKPTGCGVSLNNRPSDEETNQEKDSSGGGGRDTYEFIAFLLWYSALVLCCIVPTYCGYRRRRQNDVRMAQQEQNINRWQTQAANMYAVAGLRQDSEQIQAHRTAHLEKELKLTTMVSFDIIVVRLLVSQSVYRYNDWCLLT